MSVKLFNIKESPFTFQHQEEKSNDEIRIGEDEDHIESQRRSYCGKYRRKYSKISEVSLRLDRRRFMQVEHDKRMEILETELESKKEVHRLKVEIKKKLQEILKMLTF